MLWCACPTTTTWCLLLSSPSTSQVSERSSNSRAVMDPISKGHWATRHSAEAFDGHALDVLACGHRRNLLHDDGAHSDMDSLGHQAGAARAVSG